MKKLGLVTVALSVLLLSGCGGSKKKDSKKDPMNDKRYIAIWTEIASGICESAEFRHVIVEAGASDDVLIKETSGNTSCETYGKKNDDNECAMGRIGNGDKNCVAGFNTFTNKQAKIINDDSINLSEILDTGIQEL